MGRGKVQREEELRRKANAEAANAAAAALPFQIRAARAICQQSLNLLAYDVPSGMPMEAIIYSGMEHRLELMTDLAQKGASDAFLHELVCGTDPYLPDRLRAAWWTYCYPKPPPDGTDPDGWFRSQLIRSVSEMIADETMTHEIERHFDANDPYASERIRMRRYIAKVADKIRALSEM